MHRNVQIIKNSVIGHHVQIDENCIIENCVMAIIVIKKIPF